LRRLSPSISSNNNKITMALPKNKSRIITIDGVKYRFMIGPNDGFNIFYAQNDITNGSKIMVYFDTDIDSFWLNFPGVDDLNLKNLKPKEAESVIRQAIKLGWNSEERGKTLIYTLTDGIIEERKKTKSLKNRVETTN
jgi:hypothetical protein